MGIEIKGKRVSQVLLSDGKWHDVMKGSFDVGDEWPWQQDGQTTGAHWLEASSEAERKVFCPLSSICAVAYEWDSSPKD
jgi:hypothetical protein